MNKSIFILFGIVMLIGLVGSISAFNLNYFGNNNNVGYCYQESTNISNQDGTDGNCGLSYSGSYNIQYQDFKVNYSKPSNHSSNAIWKIKYGRYGGAGLNPITINITIPDDCFNYYTNNVSLRWYNPTAGYNSNQYFQCWNGSWETLLYQTYAFGYDVNPDNVSQTYDGDWNTCAFPIDGIWRGNEADGALCEEAIYWDISNLTSENLTFSSNSNITRYLSVPSNTYLTNGFMNLTGYSSGYNGLNNYSNKAGSSSTENACEKCTKMTVAQTGKQNILMVAYDDGAFGIPIMKIRDNSNNLIEEHIMNCIDQDCIFNSTNILNAGTVYEFCVNASAGGIAYEDQSSYTSITIGGICPTNGPYVNITAQGNINNPSILIGTNKVWNYSGVFNVSNATNNLANSINNYLSTCSYSNGFCQVPFTFHSDSAGIINYFNLSFNDSGILTNNVTYSNSVTTYQLNNIIGNFTLPYGFSQVTLNYNGTISTPSIVSNGYMYILNSTVVSPVFNSNTNISFYYNFTINGATYLSNVYNQTVNTFNISTNCAGGFSIINISNYDEENLSSISGTVEYYLNLGNGNSTITSVNGTFTGTNISLCSSINLSNSFAIYNLNLRYYDNLAVYYSGTYNIQNSLVSNLPLVINLYYENKSIGTLFKIDYTDFNYITYPGALIQIQRQYLGTNTYNLVEVPQIANDGTASGAFNTNNVRYKILVINNGVILDEFDNLFPTCQNVVLGECTLSLRGSNNVNQNNNGDFTYTLVNSNNTLTLTYIIPSGTPRSITFLTNQSSRFLNDITNCNSTLFASGGTIICTYNSTAGDSIIQTTILNSDGSKLYGQIPISEDLSQFFLLNNYFIAFVLLLSIGLMFISSPTMLILGAVIGVVYLGLVFLLRGVDWITLTGSLGWIIVAAVAAIYFISKREDRS